MLNKTFIYSATIAMAVILSGCSDENLLDDSLLPDSPGTITLHLQSSDISRSAASDNSENRIRTISIGLYPATAPETAAATAWKTVDFTNAVNGATSVVFKLNDAMISSLFNDTDGATCRFYAIANATGTVPEYASIQTIKNLTVSSPFDSKKIQDSFVMTATGDVQYQEGSSLEAGKASGSGSLYRAAAKIRLNLNIPNEIVIRDDNGNVKERWTPVDQQNSIYVLLNNGVTTSIADPNPDSENNPWKPSNPAAYYKSDLGNSESVRILTRQAAGEYPFVMDVPLYTYPNAWTESVEETNKTTLTLIVPWHKEGEPDSKNTAFYYQVPITPAEITNITRNYFYSINLTVGMLGSLAEDEPMLIDDVSYQIVNWASEDIGVGLNNIRYLVVNPNVYSINNESVISIPFYTSHTAEISNITMTYQRFNYPSNGTGEVVDITLDKTMIDKSLRKTKGETEKICDYYIERDPTSGLMTIKIIHPMTMWIPVTDGGSEVGLTTVGPLSELSTTLASIDRYVYPTEMPTPQTPQMAYFPYKFKLTIRHIDEHSFSEEVEITQYPGMYIVAEMNTGGTIIQNNPNSPSDYPNVNQGFVFLNAKRVYDDNGNIAWQNANIEWAQDWGLTLTTQTPRPTDEQFVDFLSSSLGGLREYTAPSADLSLVNNYNMYVINITQLTSSDTDYYGNSYIIGDPRAEFINNTLFDDNLALDNKSAGKWCNKAYALYDGSNDRTLSYYYPTDETEITRMMVAPKIRVSSTFGYIKSTDYLSHKALCRRRAATYQEREFPAGRWRLPTYGEVSFICNLSAQGKIPTLFREGQVYMTAQGPYEIVDNGKGKMIYRPDYLVMNLRWSNINKKWQLAGSTSTTPSRGCNVRPVYDEWYWENQEDYTLKTGADGKYVYTFGDVPITRPNKKTVK